MSRAVSAGTAVAVRRGVGLEVEEEGMCWGWWEDGEGGEVEEEGEDGALEEDREEVHRKVTW